MEFKQRSVVEDRPIGEIVAEWIEKYVWEDGDEDEDEDSLPE